MSASQLFLAQFHPHRGDTMLGRNLSPAGPCRLLIGYVVGRTSNDNRANRFRSARWLSVLIQLNLNRLSVQPEAEKTYSLCGQHLSGERETTNRE